MDECCQWHRETPPVADAAEAETVSRRFLKLYPEVVPGMMSESSYPEAIACCARGAYAMSLMHTAVRKILNENKTT